MIKVFVKIMKGNKMVESASMQTIQCQIRQSKVEFKWCQFHVGHDLKINRFVYNRYNIIHSKIFLHTLTLFPNKHLSTYLTQQFFPLQYNCKSKLYIFFRNMLRLPRSHIIQFVVREDLPE